MSDEIFMREALAEAHKAADEGEVPVGAVVVWGDEVIGRGHNRREAHQNPLAHAELEAIDAAAVALSSWRLTDCTLYATLEPCPMCAGALVNSRVERLVFGASDPKAGFVGSLGNLVQDPRLNHRLQVSRGLLAEESSTLLKSFFANLRRDL
jgi:tRNA(adenine34) deaminase